LAKKRKKARRGKGKPNRSGQKSPSSAVGIRRAADQDAWELVPPRCARERTEDMEEVEAMLAAGEVDVATDELRWLLNGCACFINAHKMLGELAAAENDFELARAHFGHAYQEGLKAVRRVKLDQPLSYEIEANRPFFEAAKGLVYCLLKLDRKKLAREIVGQMIKCDPTDPLGLRQLVADGGN
jgi:hypothetical protein